MKLIVGLGNPGEKYLQTRHNIGFVLIDFIAQKLGKELEQTKFNGIFYKDKEIILAKPTTYMNLSGDFVQQIAKYFKIKHEDILIIYDDMDHKIGKFSIRKTGNSGGHNGIEDIINKLHSMEINRIKIGIGRGDVGIEHVLGKFHLKEKKLLHDTLDNCIKASIDFINHDVDYLMNKYNRKK